jgi:hypothetical protein
MLTSPIPVDKVYEPWAQWLIRQAGGVTACNLLHEPLALTLYLSAPGCPQCGFGAKTVGPLVEIAIDPDNPEHLRIAQEAVDHARGCVPV